MSFLSLGSQLVLVALLTTLSSAAMPRTTPRFQGVPVRPGGTIAADVPLDAKEKADAAIDGNRVPEHAVAVLGVPPGFDPAAQWPVLVVFSTSDRGRQNRDDVPFYLTAALRENWLVLAGDGPKPPRKDSTGWRSAMTLAALDALHRSFPGSHDWPVACAGISGGAKRACLIAPLLAKEGNNVVGLYLAGINEDLLEEGYRTFKPGRDFLRTKIFITSGLRDRIATPTQTEEVQRSFERDGFARVRLETFPEGHNVKRPLTLAALQWFRADSQAAPARNTSGLHLAVKEIGGRLPDKRGSTGAAPPASPGHLVVTVTDFARQASTLTAHVYFVGRSADGERFIYADSECTIKLRSAPAERVEIPVAELKPDPNKPPPPHGMVYTGIGEAEGWIVTGRVEGKMFGAQASSAALLDVARSRALNALVADYQHRRATGGYR